jgi:hypothetical protein
MPEKSIRPTVSRSVYHAEFKKDLTDRRRPLIEALGLDAGDLLNRAQSAAL